MSSPLQPPNVTYAGTKPLFLRTINDINAGNDGNINVVGDQTYTKELAIGNTIAIAFQPVANFINSRYGICGTTQLIALESIVTIVVPGMTPTGFAMITYINSGINLPDEINNIIASITYGVNEFTIVFGHVVGAGDTFNWFCPRLSLPSPP
jgi:hypothetical protein